MRRIALAVAITGATTGQLGAATRWDDFAFWRCTILDGVGVGESGKAEPKRDHIKQTPWRAGTIIRFDSATGNLRYGKDDIPERFEIVRRGFVISEGAEVTNYNSTYAVRIDKGGFGSYQVLTINTGQKPITFSWHETDELYTGICERL